MDPMTMAMIAGPVVGGMMGMYGSREANTAASNAADKQMVFLDKMSSTAHQREVEDLRKAGLNPLLSANAGASTPGAGMPAFQNNMDAMAASASEISRNLFEKRKQDKELEVADATKNKIAADTTLAKRNAALAEVQATVLSKGIPEADMKNKMYDAVKPMLDKGAEKLKSTVKQFIP